MHSIVHVHSPPLPGPMTLWRSLSTVIRDYLSATQSWKLTLTVEYVIIEIDYN